MYVVATPIGNPDDISARAIRTLGEVSLIACEDTRRTGQLLARHQIGTPTISHFEHNEERRVPELVERLKAGEKIALVTDAGTPAISDPGFRLVRAALEANVRVIAVPGASAAVAAISIAGIPTDRFTFEGFVPTRDAARRKALDELRREPRTMVFYEASRTGRGHARSDGGCVRRIARRGGRLRNHQDLRADYSRDARRTGTGLYARRRRSARS